MKYKPKTKPFPHQSRATLAAVRHRNYGVFFEPRLGKSKVAIDYTGVLSLKGEVTRVLICAPSIALDVWRRELRRHCPYPYTLEDFDYVYHTPKGGSTTRRTTRTVQFFLCSREETFRAVRRGKKLVRPKQSIVEKWRPQAIIIDESHQYKRPGGRGAQDAWRLVRRLRNKDQSGRPYVLLLSGTPNPKGWRDLFAQFRIMDETVFGTSVGDFDEDHVVYGHGRRRYTILAYRGEKRILRKVRQHSLSVSAEEAGLANHREWNPLTVTLPARAMTAYEEMAEDFITEVEGGTITAKNIGVVRLRLLQITGGFTTEGAQIHRAKVDAVRDWCLLLSEQDEPYVVGCRFTPEVLAAAEALSKFSRLEVVHGATRKSRDLAIKAFSRGRLDALVFQVDAGSAAIDLSRAAEMVLYSFPDGWVSFKQFTDRVTGPHQLRPVRYTPVLARHTLDSNVVRGLIRKEAWHDELMDNPRAFLRGLAT